MNLVEVLHDVRARITRAIEAVQDGDLELAVTILDDLDHDVWLLIEREGHAT